MAVASGCRWTSPTATSARPVARPGVSFADQGEVLINTRLAADVLRRDQDGSPGWGAVSPNNGDVCTLTKHVAHRRRRGANYG